jgi:hypothetical protein
MWLPLLSRLQTRSAFDQSHWFISLINYTGTVPDRLSFKLSLTRSGGSVYQYIRNHFSHLETLKLDESCMFYVSQSEDIRWFKLIIIDLLLELGLGNIMKNSNYLPFIIGNYQN